MAVISYNYVSVIFQSFFCLALIQRIEASLPGWPNKYLNNKDIFLHLEEEKKVPVENLEAQVGQQFWSSGRQHWDGR